MGISPSTRARRRGRAATTWNVPSTVPSLGRSTASATSSLPLHSTRCVRTCCSRRTTCRWTSTRTGLESSSVTSWRPTTCSVCRPISRVITLRSATSFTFRSCPGDLNAVQSRLLPPLGLRDLAGPALGLREAFILCARYPAVLCYPPLELRTYVCASQAYKWPDRQAYGSEASRIVCGCVCCLAQKWSGLLAYANETSFTPSRDET